MRVVTLSIMAGATLAFAACGGGGLPAGTRGPRGPIETAGSALGPTPTAAGPGATAAATAAACVGSGGTPVSIADNAFDPLRVIVSRGGVVTWTNADDSAHTVTFNTGPDCGEVGPGQSLSRTFALRGNFIYRCTIHTSMRGTVEVK